MTREEFLERVVSEIKAHLCTDQFFLHHWCVDSTLKVIRAEVNRMYVNDQEFGNAAGWNGALDKINNELIRLLPATGKEEPR